MRVRKPAWADKGTMRYEHCGRLYHAPDDEENPGNLGPIVRGYDDAPQVPAVDGSPFLTPTVPLQLKRAKGGMYDEDSTGFAAKKLVWFRDTEGASGFCRGSVKSVAGDKVTLEQEGNHRQHTVLESDTDKVIAWSS